MAAQQCASLKIYSIVRCKSAFIRVPFCTSSGKLRWLPPAAATGASRGSRRVGWLSNHSTRMGWIHPAQNFPPTRPPAHRPRLIALRCSKLFAAVISIIAQGCHKAGSAWRGDLVKSEAFSASLKLSIKPFLLR
jgi:hypothetical protein